VTQHSASSLAFRTFKIVIAGALLGAYPLLSGCVKDRGEPTVPTQALPIQSFERDWAVATQQKNGTVDRLFLRDPYLFAYTDKGTVYIINRTDGSIVSIADVPHGRDQLRSPVVLRDRIVFPTTVNFEVYDRTGNYIGPKTLSYSIRSNAVGSGSAVYVGADFRNGGRVVKADITRKFPDHVWELMFGRTSVSAAPALLGDTVYAAAEDGEVTAVDNETRNPLWPINDGIFRMHGAVVADLVVDDSGLYIASEDETLVCLNRQTGKLKWQYTAGTPLDTSPIVTKDLVFQYVAGTGLVVIDKRQGDFNRKPLWVASDVNQFLAEDEHYVLASSPFGMSKAQRRRCTNRHRLSKLTFNYCERRMPR
jgi:outer membrane protein assembly factor BamB